MSEEMESGKGRDPTEKTESEGGLQLSAMIDKIMANPQLISMVASALGGADRSAPSGEAEVVEAVKSEPSLENVSFPTPEKLPELIAALSPLVAASAKGDSVVASKGFSGRDKRSCLLSALKPYLNRERCEAIDYMIRLGALSDIFRGLGG